MILVLILSILVFLSGCNNYIFRDYFPLKDGNQWVYTDGESDFLSYVEEYVEDYDTVYHLVLGSKSMFLKKDYDGIHVKRELIKTYLGEKIFFDEIYEYYLPNPPVNGDSFIIEKNLEKIAFGDTIFYYYMNFVKVRYLNKLEFNEKKFRDCYKVERFLILDTDTIQTKEYYAPEIGLVKFEENGKVWYIKEWSLY